MYLQQLKMTLQLLTGDWQQIIVLGKRWEHGWIMLIVIPSITNKHCIMHINKHLKWAENQLHLSITRWDFEKKYDEKREIKLQVILSGL